MDDFSQTIKEHFAPKYIQEIQSHKFEDTWF